MDINLNSSEIKELLYDISVYLRNELQSLEYENTLKVQNEAKCKDLLDRCSYILTRFEPKTFDQEAETCSVTTNPSLTECSYLDMSAKKSKAVPGEYVDFSGFPDNENDTCTEKIKEDDDKEIYEICNETLQTIKSSNDEDTMNCCPYIGLPATHLSIVKSPKYGQLLRIEKRIFFGQTKKYYSAIIQDWLLCYGDEQSIRPTFCIHLNNVVVEHFGEGKRRDLCFEIREFETAKKIVFQASDVVDTKEWIHAIEAAIRRDFDAVPSESPTKVNKSLGNTNNNLRKLPTPPVDTKRSLDLDIFNEDIYEEPCSLYSNSLIITESDSLNPPDIPIKTRSKSETCDVIIKHDYDVPKSSQPDINLLQNSTTETSENTKSILPQNRAEFQTKFKDVHSKLTNQLSASSADRLKGAKNTPPTPRQSPSHDTTNNTKAKLFKDKNKVVSNAGSPTTLSPVKNSFWSRLSKTSPQDSLKVKPAEKEKENLISSEVTINTSVLKTAKGGKVNMIINQLEANGHLPISTRNFERFSKAFSDSGEDCN